MERPRAVSRADWLVARKELLVKEKESSRRADALAKQRRALPMVLVQQDYVFEGPGGPTTLLDLFGGSRQLLVYHFMFNPSWEEGCRSCSHFADNFAGALPHLAARDTSFAAVSLAPLGKLNDFARRMGWSFPWLSSAGTTFNQDFQVTIDADGLEGSAEYNYAPVKSLLEMGKVWFPKGELPGLSVFYRDGDTVFHTYSAYQRGLDLFLNTYNFLDLTPLGRQEEGSTIQSWIRHHDKYAT